MNTRKYNKLIRDNIPEITIASGGDPKYHVASSDEYMERLKEKLFEEIEEFFEEKDENEMADIFEVLYALGKEYSINFEKVEELRKHKLQKSGAFHKKFILDEVIGGNYK